MVFLFTVFYRRPGPALADYPFKKDSRFVMKHTVPLTQNHMFRKLYRSGRNWVTPYFALYTAKNRQTCNRLGLTASKKIGNAVQRNRARRVLKEAYRLLEMEMPKGYDLVFVARKKALFVKMDTVKNAMEPILLKFK